MDYLVKGWNQYSFIVSPNNLKHILNPYHIVIFNAHVPLDYTESGLEECITSYSVLYDLLLSGNRICWERDNSLFMDWGITSNLSNCTYGHPHLYEGKMYKLADFHEPVVGMSPSTLWIHIGEDKKLSCSSTYSYVLYSENYMGARLEYPKMIQYKVGGNYEALRTTKTLEGYRDFDDLKKSINKITHILTIKTAEGITKRTGIRVDDETKSRLNACYLFQQNGITVV